MPRTPTEATVRTIYRETLDELYGVVSRRCDGDRELAEDVVQEAWLRALRAWQYDGIPDVPIAWLTTVSLRILSNHFRRKAESRLDDESWDEVPAAELESDERQSLLQRALGKLPALQKTMLEAFHFDRHPVAEIASRFGMSERAVEGRLRRARQNLRRQIDIDASIDGDIQ